MISVREMFTVGIGPSSSHTVGPMKAAHAFVTQLAQTNTLGHVSHIKTELYGSLGQTGKGHGSGKAVILGLAGFLPESVDIDAVDSILTEVDRSQQLKLLDQHWSAFPNKGAITFHFRKSLPKHSNGMMFSAFDGTKLLSQQVYYSIGGGFIVSDEAFNPSTEQQYPQALPYPFTTCSELLAHCQQLGLSIASLVKANEAQLAASSDAMAHIRNISDVMEQSIVRGCRVQGLLPGGLKLQRRAPQLARQLKAERHNTSDPLNAMDWVNLYALAVNEENAAGGRVVTAPTNGAAGVIPAVLAYYRHFIGDTDDETLEEFFLTATAIGTLYKYNASISGAEVGCQGEVGVACSMAAAALTAIMGGTPAQIENAAEIGMEHNLGLTCDPVGGLVQVPCIERNAMGAIKAINASRLALRGSGLNKVSLDKVIKTMRDTGRDMKSKYKETARGGLAVNIIEC
ncbi:L-serine ammonia-lyase [Echinimonas agarilytica]|uniref:L-serine dehydratase n=1 Tax=Echinimonas agarilytica TaxID=1215918 RepID=A0AA42B7V9_9GAMM|nr:L-serine ammonia-lyase [Echinimonas agarilytica]MCM2679778.1 L-serine ammonia-lyase [Echinimonas agarilytica]